MWGFWSLSIQTALCGACSPNPPVVGWGSLFALSLIAISRRGKAHQALAAAIGCCSCVFSASLGRYPAGSFYIWAVNSMPCSDKPWVLHQPSRECCTRCSCCSSVSSSTRVHIALRVWASSFWRRAKCLDYADACFQLRVLWPGEEKSYPFAPLIESFCISHFCSLPWHWATLVPIVLEGIPAFRVT